MGAVKRPRRNRMKHPDEQESGEKVSEEACLRDKEGPEDNGCNEEDRRQDLRIGRVIAHIPSVPEAIQHHPVDLPYAL